MKSSKQRLIQRRRKQQKRRLKKQRRQTHAQYAALEPRCLLATSVDLAITGSTFQTDSFYSTPDPDGDVGLDHMIEALNGRIKVIDQATGVHVQSWTLASFFSAAGATVFNDPINAQVVFDRISERWFVAANGTGPGNWLYLAFSDTSDPSGTWQQLQFVGDSTGTHFTGEITLSVDADAVYLTTKNQGPGNVENVSLYSLPKTDIFSPDPTLTNMSRFELLDPTVYGTSLRVANNFEASDGQAFVVGSGGPSGVFVTPIMNPATSTATLGTPQFVNTDPDGEYSGVVPAEQLPDDVTGDDAFVETTDELTSDVYEIQGSIWGAKTVGWSQAGGNNAIDWFEFEPVTATLIQSGTVGEGGRHYYNPSIAVNSLGIVGLSYNRSSTGSAVGAYTTVGITVQGLAGRNTQMEPAFVMEPGLESYNTIGETEGVSPWSFRSSIDVDPESINRFFSVQPWANTVDRWATHNALIRPIDMQPVVEGDENNNVIVIRRSASDPTLMEIEFDGVVTDVFPYEVLGRVEIRGMGGADRFIIDYSNGDPIPLERGLLLDGGAGPDVIQVENSIDNTFVVNGPDPPPMHQGTFNEISEFDNIEELWGGYANDTFLVEGFLDGSLIGRSGDDTFEFAGTGRIGGSANGDEGFNTLSFLNRKNTAVPPAVPPPLPTEVFLVAPSANQGFNGTTPDGPVGGDELADQFRDISRLIGSQTELDTIHALDEVSTWTVDGANSTYEAVGRTLEIDFWDAYYASSFDDTFNVRSNTLDPLRMFGLDGNDVYNFSSDAPLNTGSTESIGGLIYALGGAGDNVLNVSNMSGPATETLILAKRISGMGEIVFDASIDGGTFAVDVTGSQFDDTFLLHSFDVANTMTVRSMGGNDTFDIQDLSKAQVDVLGGAGDDLYLIEMVQGVSFRNLHIQDSVNAELDRVSLRGTVLDEVFNINPMTFVSLEVTYDGIEQFGALGRGGDDVFNVTGFDAPLFIDGEDGNDVINISSDAPTNMGDLLGFTDDIVVDGGAGFNQMVVSNLAGAPVTVNIFDDRIEGMLPVTLFYTSTGGQFANVNGTLDGIHLIGSDAGTDVFDVMSLDSLDSILLDGRGGNETFYVRAEVDGAVGMDGGEGSDKYRLFFRGSGNRMARIMDSGTSGSDRAFLVGTPMDDDILITDNSVSRNGEMVWIDSSLRLLQLPMNDGNDSFTMNNTPAEINNLLGQVGHDSFTINGTVGATGMRLVGDSGFDTFEIAGSTASTFIRVVGKSGNDLLSVLGGALGDVSSDLGEGSDAYIGGFVGSGSRWFGALDTGTTGTDTLTVFGTDNPDLLEIRSANVYDGTERIAFGGTSEELTVQGGLGDDQIEMFASFAPITRLEGQAGDDWLWIRSSTHAVEVTALGGDGDDRLEATNVHVGTTLTLDGEAGDDFFVVGSDSVADNGNLGLIRGPVTVIGGDSGIVGDSLEASDAAIGGAYGYEITGSYIVTHPGRFNVVRTNFAGIFYDTSLESVRLDGSQLANTFIVSSDPFKRFYFDGSDPAPGGTFGDQIELTLNPGDGHAFQWTNRPLGEGQWTFTNGDPPILFENIEQAVDPPPASPIAYWPTDTETGPNDDGDTDSQQPDFIRVADPAGPVVDSTVPFQERRRFEWGQWFDQQDFADVDDVLASLDGEWLTALDRILS